MSQTFSQSSAFKLALEWEDDDEIVVKVEPIEEGYEEDEQNIGLPIDAAREEDLIPEGDWTAEDDVIVRSFVNKTRIIPVKNAAKRKTRDIDEITFRVQEDETIELNNESSNKIGTTEDFRQEIMICKNDSTSTYSILLNATVDRELRAKVEEYSNELLGYYCPSREEEDTESIDDSQVETPTGLSPLIESMPANISTTDAGGQKIIYLTKVTKEMVLQNAKTVTKLPGKVMVHKSDGPNRNVDKEDVKIPRNVDKRSMPRSYLRKIDDIRIPEGPSSTFLPKQNLTSEYIKHHNPKRILVPIEKVSNPKKVVVLNTPQVARNVERKRRLEAIPTVEQMSEMECPTCGKLFSKKKYLLVHLKTHLAKEREPPSKKCDVCDKMFRDNTQLKIHSRVHSGITPYHCVLCPKQFKHQTSLARHLLYHTKERPYLCDYPKCTKTYRNNSDLVNHKRTHTNERPFACSHCGKAFSDRCARNTHERIHNPIKNYLCPICRRSFTQSSTLKCHMLTHSDERPFECDYCQRKFKSKVVLRSHIRTHTAEKTFKCTVCLEMFTENRTLQRHIYTHKEFVKPFPCTFCKRWYFREKCWKAHVETHKAIDRPFACDLCTKCYPNEGYLRLHKTKAHGIVVKKKRVKAYACTASNCRNKFVSRLALKAHKRKSHKKDVLFACDGCKKTFPLIASLEKHIAKNHISKPDSVKKIGKSVVKVVATGDEQKCGSCKKFFECKSTFVRHVKRKCCN